MLGVSDNRRRRRLTDLTLRPPEAWRTPADVVRRVQRLLARPSVVALRHVAVWKRRTEQTVSQRQFVQTSRDRMETGILRTPAVDVRIGVLSSNIT